MNNIATFESREARINADIQASVNAILAQPRFDLPLLDADIVQSYVQKIQGSYNVERAKADTDNAIDLLYIAYNTTPQVEDDVRIRIGAVMNKLITSQQKSEMTMRGAMGVADSIRKSLAEIFPDWLDIKESGDQTELKGFVSKDLVVMAKDIRDKALKVRDQLLVIASFYDEIITETVLLTAKSETLLSARLKDKIAMEREINEANAKREQLESLVGDLKVQVAEFEKKARDYEQRANTAEQRAFVMSLIKVGAQMISSAIPAIAMAVGGPAPMLASAVGGLLSGQPAASPSGAQPQSTGNPKPDSSAGTQTKLSEEKAELKKSEEKRDGLKADMKALEESKSKLVDPAGGTAASGKAVELAEIDKRIKVKADDLRLQEEAVANRQKVISSLQDSLAALDKGLTKLTDEQQQQAASLRDIQMQMIDKAEAYEKERRNQTAELIKVTALLKGKRSEDETIQLAIKSLNVSLSALKRMKEIIEEVAFFFKSFADFMEAIATQASDQVESIDNVVGLETIRKNRLAQLVKSVDEFFIRQTAQWYAVANVSDRFSKSFADGWSKLNKLSGDYITGDRLNAYLQTASAKITAIVAEREAAADAKIASLNAYREQLLKSA
jgi:DNA repair exonuclease SbcCD ATPase subunit